MKGTDKMKVGDYIITKDGLHIGKIYNINDFREPSMKYAIDFPNADDFIFMGEEDFISSPDIIDLIQVGDYVDKLRVVGKDENYIVVETFDERIFINKEDTIKSIVTKEQFENCMYKVGE